MAPLAGYLIDSKTLIKALTPEQRTNGYSRATTIGTNAEWYMFISSSTSAADDDLVLIPNDNPTTGRWHKYASNRGGGGFGGQIICTTGCTVAAGGSGKAFQFYAPHSALELIIEPGFDINIQNVADAIRVYRYSQEPNTSRTGQEATPIATLPKDGGKILVDITSIWRWIVVFTRNPAQGNNFDCACCSRSGNVLTPLGYS
ncbi:hypothetical protein [Nostoc sp.]|uniref:hypothetical protein n=1 Tax=Nostoc sp. TaxID=1180 RepID=UPI002FF7182C